MRLEKIKIENLGELASNIVIEKVIIYKCRINDLRLC